MQGERVWANIAMEKLHGDICLTLFKPNLVRMMGFKKEPVIRDLCGTMWYLIVSNPWQVVCATSWRQGPETRALIRSVSVPDLQAKQRGQFSYMGGS